MYEYTVEWFEILERKASYYSRLLEEKTAVHGHDLIIYSSNSYSNLQE